MKKRNLLLLSALAVGLTTARSEDALPMAPAFSRYEPMLKHSPFAVASAGAPVGVTPDFAKELYVANAGHSEKGDFVTIASTTNRDFKLYLTTGQNVDGYSVPNIQWSDRVGETKVTLTKGGQIATLSFNEAILSEAIHNSAPQNVRSPMGNAVPGIPGRPPANIPMPVPRPMTVPTLPTPPPYTRGLIRRSGEDGNNAINRTPQNRPRPGNDDPDDD
jgi:hypothetical protein